MLCCTIGGELEDHQEEDEEDDMSSDDNDVSGSSAAGPSTLGGSSDEYDYDEDDDSSSEVDSLFGSELDGDDEDLGDLRKKAGRRGSAARCVYGRGLWAQARA